MYWIVLGVPLVSLGALLGMERVERWTLERAVPAAPSEPQRTSVRPRA